MTTTDRLVLAAYAPTLVAGDVRPLAIVHGMERALPGLRLEWQVSKEGRPVELPQRDAWLLERTRDRGFPVLCNGDEGYPVTVTGWDRPARLSAGGQSQLVVHAKQPQDAAGITAAADLLAAVAEGSQAFWGHVTPVSVTLLIAEQMGPQEQEPDSPDPLRGLPALKLPEHIPAPEIPHFLGWLNYWSAAAARVIGFPDPARDADLLTRARRTESGGWVVQLTEAPLDLDDPTHLEALRRAYERFPAIGGRSDP